MTIATQESAKKRVFEGSLGERRQLRPVIWWTLGGSASIAMVLYSWTRWIVSGNFKPTPHGPTPLPHFMRVSSFAEEVLGVGLAVVFFYFCIVRPWRRERRLTLDGMIFIALFCTCFWQDMLSSFLRVMVLYNSYFVQFGSWTNFVPWVRTPRANLLSEPLIREWANYAAYVLPPLYLVNYLLRPEIPGSKPLWHKGFWV
jgi:Spirocyclase AveC-like